MDYMTMNFNRNGGSGTSDYSQLTNKPSINDVTLSGNKTSADLGLMPEYEVDTTPTESSDNLITSGGVWEADNNIKDKLQGAKTVTGNPITITDAEAMNAESVKVELEPKQDLHGHDGPWVGGAGKNKLPLVLADIKSVNTSGTWSGNTYALNGVTFEVLTDSADNIEGIKVNGTASATAELLILKGSSNDYVGHLMNCEGVTTILASIAIQYFEGGAYQKSYIIPDSTTNYEVENAGSTIDMYARIESGYSVPTGGILLRPMLRLATETDADFEPYSNICPISGYSEVNVNANGQTITIDLDGTKYGGTLDVTNGVLTVDRMEVEYDGSVDETWGKFGSSSASAFAMIESTIIANADVTVRPISNELQGVNRSDTWGNYHGFVSMTASYVSGSGQIVCGIDTITTVEDWITFLSNNPLRVCYKLATPLTVQLTPTDIPLLENTNNISTNGTNIQLKYQPNNVIGECKAYTDEKCAKVLPQPPTTDGTYHLECSVSSGIPTITWVSNS